MRIIGILIIIIAAGIIASVLGAEDMYIAELQAGQQVSSQPYSFREEVGILLACLVGIGGGIALLMAARPREELWELERHE